MYASNSRPSKYMKQIEKILKEEIDSSTIITEDFITHSQSESKERNWEFNTTDQLDLAEHFTQQQQHLCSPQVYMGYFSRVD